MVVLTVQALLMVNDHAVMGSQLILIAGQRLAHFVLTCDPPGSVEMLSRCSPTVSTWLKTLVSTRFFLSSSYKLLFIVF